MLKFLNFKQQKHGIFSYFDVFRFKKSGVFGSRKNSTRFFFPNNVASDYAPESEEYQNIEEQKDINDSLLAVFNPTGFICIRNLLNEYVIMKY